MLPAISGTTVDGSTLSATTGTWTGTPTITYAYQWRRCNAAGASCADIAGETASTYALTPGDVGHALRIIVTATNGAGSASATSAATAAVSALPPANTALPTISGTTTEASTLSAANGTWTGTPAITYAFQWRRCNASGGACADIAGATGSTYDLVPADVGATIRVVVTATNAGGSGSATSAQSAVIAARPPVNTLLPSISGTTTDGATLSADDGTWSGTPTIAETRQWRRCDADGTNCADITGATAATYDLTPADVGHALRVVVTATNGGGSASATSAATSAIDPAPPVNTALPSISGSVIDGATVTASNGSWTGTPAITYSYQWRRCDASGGACADIAGATNATHDVAPADVGHALRVVVTATNVAGSGSATSAATSPVDPAPPVNTSAPTVAGSPIDGGTLTAMDGTWTGTPTITFGYQWRRCDADGTNCADIAGEVGATYAIVSADIGHAIRVVVSGSNAGGTVPATSAATSSVDPSPPAVTTQPSITGTTVDGNTLTAGDGAWTGTGPITYAHQWRRCDADGTNCADITGAAGATYDLIPADVGHAIRVVVTATGPAGSNSATSSAAGPVTATPPVNTVAPSITGTVAPGSSVSAASGTWTGTPAITYTYQWRRCDVSGGNCSNITGATNASHNVTGSDSGSTLRVVVTATNAAGNASATSSQTITVPGSPPVNITLPTFTGELRENRQLFADHGIWSGTATITYAYQWLRCSQDGSSCTNIFGATAQSYVLRDVDVALSIRVRVTATNGLGSVSTTSNHQGPVIAAVPANAVLPSISGTPSSGETLTGNHGFWVGNGQITETGQWQRCDASGSACVNIPGATGDTFVLGGDDVGHQMRFVVTATNFGGSASLTTAAVGPVTAAAPTAKTPPTISQVPSFLTTTNGQFGGDGPFTYSYQWQRCELDGSGCVDIPGATNSGYKPTAGDSDHVFLVKVTATNGSGSASQVSAPFTYVLQTTQTPPVTKPKPTTTTTTTVNTSGPVDLSTIPESLVSPAVCQVLTSGVGYRRLNIPGVGPVRLRIRADGVVVPESPLTAQVEAAAGRLISVGFRLDGHQVKSTGRGPWKISLTPKVLSSSARHTLTVLAQPRKGKVRKLTETMRTVACSSRFTAGQWRTAKGTGLRLRVDSRSPLTKVVFPVPATLVPSAALHPRAGLGRLRIVLSGGRRRVMQLSAASGAKSSLVSGGVMLLRGAGRPTVQLVAGKLVVTGLPARTGIVELTLYPDPKAVGKSRIGAGRSVVLKSQMRSTASPGGRSLTTTLRQLVLR